MRRFREVLIAAVFLAGVAGSVGVATADDTATVARVSAPTMTVVGRPVRLDASASTGTGLRYTWNFGDDTRMIGDAVVTHTYVMSGTYTVTLTLTDTNGRDTVTSWKITVVESLSNIEMANDGGVIMPGTGLDGSVTGDPGIEEVISGPGPVVGNPAAAPGGETAPPQDNLPTR